MKRKLLTAVCVLLASAAALSLFGCGRQLKIDTRSAAIYDTKSKIRYDYVSANYLPKSVAEEKYATFVQNSVKVDYYEVEGLSPDKWLYSELGELIRARGTADLPDFSGFNPNSLLICYNSDLNFTFAEIDDPAKVSEIADRFNNGTASNPVYFDHETYKLLFSSPDYPEFYYRLLLIVTEEATYLFDRYTQRYVEAGDLFADTVPAYSYEDHD